MRPLRVLRLCSVFALPAGQRRASDAAFDPVGGMQNHAAALTRRLADRGARQVVLTSRLCGPAGTERTADGVTVHRLGVRRRRWRQLWALGALRRLVARRHRTDVVHVHQGEDLAALPLGVLAARRSGAALVVTVHCSVRHTLAVGDRRTLLLRTLGGAIERWALRRADAVIALTSRAAVAVMSGGVPAARVAVVPSGVDVARYREATADPLPDVGRPREVFVGRLVPQKGVDDLVRAADELPDDAQVVLVGDGPLRRSLERLAARLRVAHRVHVTGFVPHAVVPAYLAHADVLVLPSRHEELGSVLLEGFAGGVPIVASRTGGITEVIDDGRTGLLVEPGHVDGLVRAIGRVLGEDRLASSLRAAAAAEAHRYDWDALAEAVLGIYRAVSRAGATRSPVAR